MLRNRRSASQAPGRSSRKFRKRTSPHTQALFEHLFESAPDANLLIAQNGQILSVNRQAEELFGYSRAELIGQQIELLIPEAQRERHVQHRSNYVNQPYSRPMSHQNGGKHMLRLDLSALRRDGSIFPAEVTLTPFQTNQNLMVLTSVRDISQRRAREQELTDQNNLVRLLQEVAIAANEATSITAAFQFATDRLCQYLKWPVGHALLIDENQQLAPTGIWCQNLPKNFDHFREASDNRTYGPGQGLPGIILNSVQPVWLTHLPDNPLFVRKEEAREVGLNTGLGIPVLAGKTVVGVLEFFHEDQVPPDPNLLAVLPHLGVQLGRVVEREQAQEALRKTAAQLEMIVTNLPVFIWVVDKEGRLLLLEGKGVRSTSLDRDSILGKSVFERFSQRPDIMALFQQALAGEEIHTEVTGSNGNIIETFFSPYRAADGAVNGVIGLSFDVSDRKRMEIELEEMRQRLLESVDAERSRLAQRLHDGPLQDLYGAFYQIQEIKNSLDESEQELTGRALQTIQSVNATLRVICGELRPTTLVHLGLQKAIRSYAELMEDYNKDLVIHLDLVEDTKGSEQMLPHNLRLGLFRIYQALISNVIHHAEARHAWVRLRMPPGKVVLEVQDNGKGFTLPDHWIDMVRKGQMGLVSAQERLQGLNGKMDIQTTPGKGTLVRVVVPRS